MAYNTTKIIASGAWVQVRIKEVDADPLMTIGLCTDASFNESFNLQEASVIGYLGPLSIDSQGYRCTIQIGTFVPETGDADIMGETTLKELSVTRATVQADGKGRTFYHLDFYNKATQEVVASFKNVIVSDNGARISPNSYVTSNMSFMAMERVE